MQFGCIRAPRQTAQNGSANDDVSRYLSTPVHFHPVPALTSGGGDGPRQLCSRLGINVHFPTDGRIVTTTRVMEATSSPPARAAPDFHIFHFFAAFVSPCVFFTLFAVPSLFPSVLCRRSFSETHFFPALTLSGHLHIPHRKFEAKQYHQTVDLTLK